MKPISPVFSHSQYPMQLFLLSPMWWLLVMTGSFLMFLFVEAFMPSISLIVSGVFLVASFIIVKVKMGRDHHSDIVVAMGLWWRFRHWRGKISAGERS